MTKSSSYDLIIERIFFEKHEKGITEIPFDREDIPATAKALNLKKIKNIGDLIYSFRSRKEFPNSILDTQPDDKVWIIKGRGIAKYAFVLANFNWILPRDGLIEIKIPDSTPEIITHYALSDEQSLLAKLRYNRLIDVFLGVVAFPLQSHLRTNLKDVGQIEIDEIYVGVDTNGKQYIIPVQAKGDKDKLNVFQSGQDINYCNTKFPSLISRAISAQFLRDDLIALFELGLDKDEVIIIQEKHYRLTQSDNISDDDLARYKSL